MPKINVAVLYGGKCAEHEVSLQSGATICAWLDKNKYSLLPVYIDKSGAWYLQQSCMEHANQKRVFPVAGEKDFNLITAAGEKIKADVFFPVLHGQYGEDGSVQGLFEQMNAAYAGCDVTASAVGMDKQISKLIAQKAGMNILEDILLSSPSQVNKKNVAAMGYPVFVKPVRQGSSVGVTRVNGEAELEEAVKHAFKFDTRVMIEKGVDKVREIVCAIIGGGETAQVSCCGEIIPKKFDFFNYDAKYNSDDGVDFVRPAKVKEETSLKIKQHTKKFFGLIAGAGFARVDFFISSDETKIYFGEINTIPGYTSHSLFPQLWQACGMENSQVLDVIIDTALKAHKLKSLVSCDRLA